MARWFLIGSCAWVALAAVLLFSVFYWDSVRCPWLVAVYFVATVIGSVVTFAAYGLDKRRATANRWRISEKALHWMAALGGWPGALLGQRVFRHKTQKVRFRLVYWLIVALHAPLVLYSLLNVSIGG